MVGASKARIAPSSRQKQKKSETALWKSRPKFCRRVTLAQMPRQYRYLDALTVSFVVILLVSNLLAQKVILLGPFHLAGHTIPAIHTTGVIVLFPITYIYGDIFTEIYGYAASRRAIWLGFFGTALLYAIASFVIALPPDPQFKNQAAFIAVFGILPRIFISSLLAFWAGEFANSYTMAKLKLLTKGEHLWTRTVGSTVVGQAVDTTLVVLILFTGTYSFRTMVSMILTGYGLKVAYEVLATPLTYLVIHALKRAEGIDTFDTHTDFSPFRFAENRKSLTQSTRSEGRKV